jgi:UDP-GlcNAc:undecaprenyl-phosphate GlcNAc-1-phosphate transferase
MRQFEAFSAYRWLADGSNDDFLATTPFILPSIANIILTFFWLVGITNAINLLDNMDGLASGVSLIAAGVLCYFFWRGGDDILLLLALALVGANLGFLVFNFPPAKIFMGDSGSLFLGFTLAALSIARRTQASNVFAVVGIPTLLFLLPILDTSLVTITRL